MKYLKIPLDSRRSCRIIPEMTNPDLHPSHMPRVAGSGHCGLVAAHWWLFASIPVMAAHLVVFWGLQP